MVDIGAGIGRLAYGVLCANRSGQVTDVEFVGEVTFRAYQGDDYDLCIWHALAKLATFSGVGRKTTMGMGTAELV